MSSNAFFNGSKNSTVDIRVIMRLPWDRQYGLRMTFVVLMVVFSVAGLIGNSLIIATIAMIRDLRTTRNVFLINMAVSDLVIIAVIVPFNVIGVLQGTPFWHERITLCMFVAGICAPGCLTAIWSVTGVALNRCVFICYNGIYDKLFTPVGTFFWVLSIWGIAFAIHLPNHVGWGHDAYAENFYMCTRETSLWTYSTFFSVVGIVLPLTITFLSYYRIYVFIRKTKSARELIIRRRTSSNVSSHAKTRETLVQSSTDANSISPSTALEGLQSSLRKEFLLVKTLFRAFAVFLVSWLPLAVLLMLPHYEIPMWVYFFAVLLAHGSTAGNSILYYISNDAFRNGFRRIVSKGFGRSRVSNMDSSSRNHERELSGRRRSSTLPGKVFPMSPVVSTAATRQRAPLRLCLSAVSQSLPMAR